MLGAAILRFVIIFGLSVLAFITFLVAGTLIGLIWLDSWRCGQCLQSPVGIYILAVLGLLILASIGIEAGEAAVIWRKYAEMWWKWGVANWTIPFAIVLSIATYFIVVNWWWIVDWWCNL